MRDDLRNLDENGKGKGKAGKNRKGRGKSGELSRTGSERDNFSTEEDDD